LRTSPDPWDPLAPLQADQKGGMGIIWTIIIGFVAGVIAKFITPGKNEPSGFVLTTILGIVGAFVATFPGPIFGLVSPGRGLRFDRRRGRRGYRPIDLGDHSGAPCSWSNSKLGAIVTRRVTRRIMARSNSEGWPKPCRGASTRDGRPRSRPKGCGITGSVPDATCNRRAARDRFNHVLQSA
jgi:uncharacterized membrane protein YeaQ/YmgE (transglycosylase-associated protein family)